MERLAEVLVLEGKGFDFWYSIIWTSCSLTVLGEINNCID